jgi:hypothetical protein
MPPFQTSRARALSLLGILALLAAAFAIGVVVGSADGPENGAYFCCPGSSPCSYSPDGDCPVAVVWCPVTKQDDSGTITCASWTE